ncbi:PAAR domain-containing protein [Brenneria populi]|uniref:PAAR domain-containing protein n=1 Tax=Brenneria populi TaxID=1505588 RepID=A0ABU6JR84_9GAMM|nr:PAAR domain-containing protein [Brenneria populi Li et al. 2015]
MSRALACLGDKTTYGRIVSASSSWFEGSKAIALSGDKAWCGKCKGTFPIVGTAEGWGETQLFVATGDRVACGCPGHVVFGSTSQYVQSFSSSTPSPSPAVSAPPYASLSSPITPIHTRVFAKSCLRG